MGLTLLDRTSVDRANMLKLLVRVSSLVLIIFFFANLAQEIYIFCLSNLLNLMMLITAGIYYSRTGNVDKAAVIALLSYYPTFITALFEPGIENSSFIWTFIFPPIAFYLLGLRQGLIHTGLMLGTIAVTYLLAHLLDIRTHYSVTFFLIVAFGVIVESFLISFFESTRLRYATLIEEQKENLKAIFDSQSSISFLTDDAMIKDANKAFFDFFGFQSLEAFFNRHNCICEYFETVDDDPLFLTTPKWLKTVLKHPEIAYKVKMKSRYFSIQIQRVNIPGRKEYVVVLNDISPLVDYQKKLESDVAKAVEQIQIQNTHLLEQSKKALLGELISFISHQLKQPLTAISATAQGTNEALLHGELDAEKMKQSEQTVLRNIDFMSRSIDNLRNFYRPNKEKESFSPAKSIEQILFLVDKSLRQHDIEVTLYQDNGDLTLNGYENEFQQVFLNLLTNAKDALVDNKVPAPTIDIRIAQNENRITVTISDNAGGIPEELIPKVFDNFFTTKGKVGTGIGLYMSKMIVEESLGGEISVKNGEKGACFTISLPHS